MTTSRKLLRFIKELDEFTYGLVEGKKDFEEIGNKNPWRQELAQILKEIRSLESSKVKVS